MRIAARHDQALAAAHQRQADMQPGLEPARQPARHLRRRPGLRHVEAGDIALVAAQFRQRLVAAAPEQVEADAATMFDPVGQRQVVACRQPQALRHGAHHRRQQLLEPALPRRMHGLQGNPRCGVELHQRGPEIGELRTATTLHHHQGRPQRLLAVAQQAPGRAIGHPGPLRRIAQRALFRDSREQGQQAAGIDIAQQRPEIPGPAQARQRGSQILRCCCRRRHIWSFVFLAYPCRPI
jgi:hypothetical protein